MLLDSIDQTFMKQVQASCSSCVQPALHAHRHRYVRHALIQKAAAGLHHHASSSRASMLIVRAQADDIEQDEGEVDASRLAPQFGGNSKFASVLAEALQRSGGADVLTTGPERIEEPRVTAQEEVTLAALRDSRRNLMGLDEMRKQLEGAIEREKKQFDRLHFSHKKAQSDAAYARTMEKLLAQERVKVAELKGLHRQ